jgi:hypothetical protein
LPGTAGLLAVAILPVAAGLTGRSYLQAISFDRGFDRAILIAAAVCALGGLCAAAFIRNERCVQDDGLSCPLDAPPLRRLTRARGAVRL